MTVLRSRAVAGNPPTAAQVKGPQIQDWAAEGMLTNLDEVAEAENWDDLIPRAIADIMKYQGNYVAVPVNVHRINWMWVNPEVFEKAGADIPKTWDQFETAAKKIQAAGMIPVAWGGQPWQEATVFETIVAGVGGTDFYIKTMVDTDPAAIDSPTMVTCLETLKMMKQFMKERAGEEEGAVEESGEDAGGQIRITREVVSVTEKKLDDSLFEIPEGYTKSEYGVPMMFKQPGH